MNNILFALSDCYMNPDLEVTQIENETELLGELCINRVAGIAYLNLKKLGNLHVIKEFENTLKAVYADNVGRAKKYKKNVEMISKLLEGVDFPYALLKGAYLTTKIYEEGFRTSNDLDILVEEDNVSKLQDILKENGFIQGYYIKSEGRIVPATRREIILSKMNYGETVPFAKFINEELFYVDINFSVDFKPEREKKTVSELLSNIERVEYGETYYYTLNRYAFFIHLCCHLYKEATTMEWVKEGRDLQLYKFSDINVYLRNCNKEYFDELYKYIEKMQLVKECYYAVANALVIYSGLAENRDLLNFVEQLRPEDISFMKEIIDPRENKLYRYDISFEEWFFVKRKEEFLHEV